MIKNYLLCFLLISLYACGGAKDNTEPPAELVDFEASAEINKLWSSSVGGGDEQQYLRLYPLMLDDRLVIADRKGEVTALNLHTGDVIWSIELDVILSGGVGGDAQHHFVSTRDGEIIALQADGKIKWRERISSEVLVPVISVDEILIIRSLDGQISSLKRDDGKLNWLYKREVPALSLRGNSRPLINRGRIYSGLDNGRLVVLDLADGRVLYDITVAIPTGRSELERMVDIDGDAALNQGVLYIASYQGRVVGVDTRKGQLLWSRKLSTSSGVEVDDSTLFSSDDRGHVWALDSSNGATLWKQEKLQARQLTRPVTMGNTIIVADFEGYLHWLSKYDGRFIARIEMDSDGILVPPIVKDNRLYVVSRGGEVAAYEIKTAVNNAVNK
jgi:outer membrane protein assembly factor BamB